MKKQIISNCTQLTINFEYVAQSTVPSKSSHQIGQPADYEESTEIEHDIMYGRGAYIYAQFEHDMEQCRKSYLLLKQFESIRSHIYR